MSNMFWPKVALKLLHVDYIMQIRYMVHPVNNEYFEVKETNCSGATVHRVNLPKVYQEHFKRLLWRLSLVITVHERLGGNRKKFKAFHASLLYLMVFLDNVIETSIRPALHIDDDDLVGRSNNNLDNYLTTEFLLSHHEPLFLHVFRLRVETNIERISFMEFDWNAYKDCVDLKIKGNHYKYNIDNIPKAHFEELWSLLEQHSSRQLDFEWSGCGRGDESEEDEGDEEEEEGKGSADEGEVGELGQKEKKDDEDTEMENGDNDNDVKMEGQEARAVVVVEEKEEEEEEERWGFRLVGSQASIGAALPDDAMENDGPAPQPSNQLVVKRKRSPREDDKDTDVPSKKRSVTPAAPIQQAPQIIGFNPSFFVTHLNRAMQMVDGHSDILPDGLTSLNLQGTIGCFDHLLVEDVAEGELGMRVDLPDQQNTGFYEPCRTNNKPGLTTEDIDDAAAVRRP
ncbi:hypothetical protein OG21DRAFT_1489269 [Imleria badia]|nr:hypothetical protein OG21DRAFT_1489269 [Imleria badia]